MNEAPCGLSQDKRRTGLRSSFVNSQISTSQRSSAYRNRSTSRVSHVAHVLLYRARCPFLCRGRGGLDCSTGDYRNDARRIALPVSHLSQANMLTDGRAGCRRSAHIRLYQASRSRASTHPPSQRLPSSKTSLLKVVAAYLDELVAICLCAVRSWHCALFSCTLCNIAVVHHASERSCENLQYPRSRTNRFSSWLQFTNFYVGR
jgi:hypothetical protein